MKKTKLALIPLIALGLSACGNVPSSQSSTAPESSVSSVAPASSAKASSAPASSKPASSAPASSAPASSSVVVKKDWDSDFKEGIAALNPDITIPYVNEFGDDYIIDDSNLDYYGTFDAATEEAVVDSDPAEEGSTIPTEIDEEEYFKAMLSEFDGTGYTATVEELTYSDVPGKYYTGEYGLKAVSSDGSTTIWIYIDYQSYNSSTGYLTISVSAKNKYDKDSFKGYDSTSLAECEEFIDGHTLPEIYLVSETTSGNYPSYFYGKEYYCFTGGSWYDQVATDAKAVLEADGWTVTLSNSDSDFLSSWVYTSGLIATKTYDDGCTVRIEIGGYGYYLKTAQMRVYLFEKYDETSATAWSQDTQNSMNETLSGNVLPFIYLGTKNEVCSSESGTTGDFIKIVGNAWDDAILENAKAALKADGFSIVEGTSSDTSGSWADGDAIIATKKFEDGSILVVEVSYEYSVKTPELRAYYSAPWTVPETATGWKETTTGVITTNISADVTIPYIYLGSINGTAVEAASYSTDFYGASYVEITGASYSNTFVDYAKGVFEDAQWFLSSVPSWSYAGGFTATTYTEDGDLITVGVGADYNGIINVRISYEKHIDVAPDATWSSDTLSVFETNLGTDITIPYIYLGSDIESASYEEASSWSPAYVYINGGADGTLLREYVLSVLENDDWTITTGDYTITTGNWAYGYDDDSCIVAKKSENGYTYRIEYGPYYDGNIELHIYKIANFVAPTEDETWSDETDALLKQASGNHEIPFLCLQADNDTLTDVGLDTYEGYGYRFNGGNWDDQCVDYIKAELEAAGYEVTVTENTDDSYYMGTEDWCYGATVLISGTQTFEDGSTVTIEIGNRAGSMAAMDIFYSEPYKLPETVPAFSDEINQTFNYYIYGMTLPENLYLGSVVYWGYSYYSGSYYLIGTDWDDQVAADAKKAFEDAGWTIDSYEEGTEMSYASLTASKENAFGETITAELAEEDGHIYLAFDYEQEDIRDENETEYPSFITDEMESVLGFKIPFVYLGVKNPMWSVSSEGNVASLFVYSEMSTESVIEDVMKDTEHEWTIVSGDDEDDFMIELRASDGNGGYYVIMAEKNATDYSGIYLFHIDAFAEPAEGANWDSSIQKTFYSLYGTSIPYALLSKDNVGLETYYWDTEFYAESFSDDVVVNYQEYYDYTLRQFQNDPDWKITESESDEGYPEFTAVKDMGDYLVTVNYMLYYYSPASSDLYFSVSRDYKYIYPDQAGAWNDTISDMLDSYFSAVEVPWIYLGCPDSEVEADYSDYYNSLTIVGGTWDDDIITKAEASLEAAGWDVTVEEGYTDPDDPDDSTPASLQATYTDKDGNQYDISIEYEDWYEAPEVEITFTPADEVVDDDDEDGEEICDPIIIPGFTC